MTFTRAPRAFAQAFLELTSFRISISLHLHIKNFKIGKSTGNIQFIANKILLTLITNY